MKIFKLFRAILLSTTVLTSPINAAPPVVGNQTVEQQADRSSALVTSIIGNTARSLGSISADRVNVKDFGAKGDATTDDAQPFNNAIAYGRTNFYGDDKKGFTLYIPYGVYYIGSSLNLTNFSNKGLHIEGTGANLLLRTNGTPGIDFSGTRWATFSGVSISADSTLTPNFGIIDRRGGKGVGDSSGCSNTVWKDIIVNGKFTIAPIYISGCETTKFYNVYGFNSNTDPNTYGIILDGINHFNVGSNFFTPAIPYSQDQFISFNEPNFFGLMATSQSTNGSALWISGTSRMTCYGCYMASQGPAGVIMYSKDSTNLINDLTFDGLVETTGTLLYDFYVTGPNPNPTLNSFKWHTQASNAANNVFFTDSTINGVSGSGVDIDINFLKSGATMFSNPLLWNLSGRYRVPQGDISWNLPSSQFSGVGISGTTLSFYGDGSQLRGIVASGGTSSNNAVTVGTIFANAVQNGGSIKSFQLNTIGSTHGGQYQIGLNNNNFPTIVIDQPSPGGQQALAHTATMGIFSTRQGNLLPGGTGYANNQTCTAIGGTFTTAFQLLINTVDSNGIPTAVSPLNNGQSYTIAPFDPIQFTCNKGNIGSGAQLANTTWNVLSVTIDNVGLGYGPSIPNFTFQQGLGAGSSTAAGTATLTTGVQIGGPTGGQMTYTANGISATGGLTTDTFGISPSTPSTSAAVCTAGQIESDATFLYICTGTNTWKRITLSTF